MRKRDFIVYGGMVVMLLLYILQSTVQLYYMTEGAELKRLRERIQVLEIENALLEEGIYKSSSYITLIQKAEELGYKKPEAKDYIFMD